MPYGVIITNIHTNPYPKCTIIEFCSDVPTVPYIYLCNNNQLNNTQNIVTASVLHFYWSFTRLWMFKSMGLLWGFLLLLLFCFELLFVKHLPVLTFEKYHTKGSIWKIISFLLFRFSSDLLHCHSQPQLPRWSNLRKSTDVL